MNEEIYRNLKRITPEEERILKGSREIEKELYMSEEKPHSDEIDAAKLLESGKLIAIRKHTRFVHFPVHTHNYVEVIYMYNGTTHHVINGTDVILKQGELLFLNQNAIQEIYPASENDIAVNFIILPEFFDYAIKMMESEENLLRSFVIDCLRRKDQEAGYLHFKVADVLPVQNLVENLIWTIMNHQANKRSMNQITMGLLLLQLMNHIDAVETDAVNEGQKLMMMVLGYIEEHYRDGELQELAKQLHYDLYWLSREIRKRTGQTYTELLQTKRLSQAGYLLSHTAMPVMDVALAVGYENISYFHRIFKKRYGISPKQYRNQYGISFGD